VPSPSDEVPSAVSQPDTVPDIPDAEAAGTDDELHRNFRAALDRKKLASHRSEEHRDGRGAGPAANQKTRREFRRKSG
jgi:Family of unknown function (DUF5302)